MAIKCDILIIGAGTAGIYFGLQMAKKGHSVIIAEKDTRSEVGKRLDVFHLDSDKFSEFDIPLPDEADPDYCRVLLQGTSYSPYGQFPKIVKYPFHVMRLPQFIQRLMKMAEGEGVRFLFNTPFLKFCFEENHIIGAHFEIDGNEEVIKSRILIDASGINAVARTTLSEDSLVANFKVGPDEKFYVILRYITWSDSKTPATVETRGWTYYKTWVAPSYHDRGAIIGVGGVGSFKNAEEVFQDCFSTIKLPAYTVDKIEKGVTPYRRPPYSLVDNGFLCMGDSACLTKPFSGEGVTAAWALCKIAVAVADNALRQQERVDAASLWDINVQYFKSQGAKFAGILATVPAAVNVTREENHFLFKNDVIFSEEDFTDMNRNFEMRMTAAKILKLSGVLIFGLLTGKFSFGSIRSLLKSVVISGKIRKHYENYPDSRQTFGEWSATAQTLWQKAGARMK
jgi:digeranylgeranylglycerophospholipid reductase